MRDERASDRHPARPTRPTSLPAWLARRAESAPFEPWLIFRDALDWAWLSYLQVADQVARAAVRIESASDRRCALTRRLEPDAIALDLAVQALGSLADPLAADSSVDGRDLRGFDIPVARDRLRGWRPETIDLTSADRGRVAVEGGGRAQVWDAATLCGRGFDLAAAIGSSGWRDRPITLACGTLRDPGVRLLVAWSLIADAVLALEPDTYLAPAAVTWVRPHVALVPAARLDEVRAAVATQKPRWRRLRFIGTAEAAAVGLDGWPPGVAEVAF